MIVRATRAGLCAAALAVAAPGAGSAETLVDALVSAYNNSDLLERQRAVLRAADEDVAQAVAALRPTLSYQISEGYQFQEEVQRQGIVVARDVETYQTNLELIAEIALFTGGRNRLAIESAKEAVLAAREGLVAQEQQVLFEAVDAYMTVLAARETVDLRENSVRLLEEEVRAARDRFEVGEVTRTVCPFCGVVDRAYALKGVRSKPSKKNPEGVERHGLWKCRECRKQFTLRKGTIFEDRHIPMNK